VDAGVVVGVHGIKGEVKFKPYGDLDGGGDDAWRGLTLYAGEDEGARGCKVIASRRHKGLVLLAIDAVPTRNAAEEFAREFGGETLYVDEKDLPPPGKGEYYYYQLVGMDVRDEDGSAVGVLKEVIETGANDVFRVVSDAGVETLLPALADVILQVDVKAMRMTVRLPDVMADDAERGD
jgi:16S rRNA processing protein RimM